MEEKALPSKDIFIIWNNKSKKTGHGSSTQKQKQLAAFAKVDHFKKLTSHSVWVIYNKPVKRNGINLLGKQQVSIISNVFQLILANRCLTNAVLESRISLIGRPNELGFFNRSVVVKTHIGSMSFFKNIGSCFISIINKICFDLNSNFHILLIGYSLYQWSWQIQSLTKDR